MPSPESNLPATNNPPKAKRTRQTFRPYVRARATIKTRLDSLPAQQRKQLDAWLFKDGLTYKQVAALLLEKFNVPINPSKVCKYWQKHSRPAAPATGNPSDVLLDVVLQSTRPIRLRILRSQVTLRTKIQATKTFKPKIT